MIHLVEPAPAFEIAWNDGASWLNVDSFADEPALIAFSSAVDIRHGPPPEDLERARAELRGLSAALLLVSRDGIWCCRPDEEAQLYVAAPSLQPGALPAMRAAFGVPPGAQAVFVLDPDGRVCFRTVAAAPAEDVTFAALVDALASADIDTLADLRR